MAAPEIKAVSFRTPAPKLRKIDELASAQHRDRTYILNEAIDTYLAMQDYHASLIHEGLRDAKAGRLISHDQVERELAAQRASRKKKTAR